MKNPWIRLYRDSIHNPKIVTLNDRQHRAWHNCMLISDDAGRLPRWRDLACHMRMTIQEAEQVVCELVEAGLIDIEGVGADRTFKMHDWSTHQYVSDNSTSRVKKFRSKNNGGEDETAMKRFSNADEAPPESDTDTDTDIVSSHVRPTASKRKKQGLNSISDVMKDDEEPEVVKRNAAGLGLNVDDLLAVTNKRAKSNRSAYFTKLCVTELLEKYPNENEEFIRDALWGKGRALNDLYARIMGAPA